MFKLTDLGWGVFVLGWGLFVLLYAPAAGALRWSVDVVPIDTGYPYGPQRLAHDGAGGTWIAGEDQAGPWAVRHDRDGRELDRLDCIASTAGDMTHFAVGPTGQLAIAVLVEDGPLAVADATWPTSRTSGGPDQVPDADRVVLVVTHHRHGRYHVGPGGDRVIDRVAGQVRRRLLVRHVIGRQLMLVGFDEHDRVTRKESDIRRGVVALEVEGGRNDAIVDDRRIGPFGAVGDLDRLLA